MKYLVFALIVLNAASAYCGGSGEMKLVNEKEIGVDSVNNIEILYRAEKISLLKSNTNSLIIKEYMNKDNIDYYANIINSGDTLTIKRGTRPHFGVFNARVEVYVPAHFIRDITVRTSSGEITASDAFTFSRVILHTSSGGISVNTLTAETADIQTASGSIRFDSIEGDVVAKTSSGSINGETVNGNVLAKSTSGNIKINRLTKGIEMETTSGSIYCSAVEIVENISLQSTSGRIELRIPQHSIFNFSTRTSSGNLSTPFPEKLFMPVSERGLVQGIIGEGTPNNNINIRTTSGSMIVKWGS